MIRRLWREFTVEIVALGLAGLGIFLLVEQMQIRVILLRFLGILLAALSGVVRFVAQGLFRRVAQLTPSDAIGLFVIALAIWLGVWRLHWRVIHSEYLSERICPECSSPLHRAHRRPSDRFISWALPVRRYRCTNRACRWTGLKLRQSV